MSHNHATLLGVSRLLVGILRVLNLVMGGLLIAMFLASFIFEPLFQEFFSKRPPRIDPGMLLPALRVWMLLAMPMIAAVHILYSRLLEVIETVRVGDPFVPENAARLRTMAWCLLTVELLRLSFGVMAAIMNAAGSNIDWSFSVNGWVAVVVVFVLARVFEEGTRIRADLEAMI